jgi:uncharacterized cupin superfamily protein
MSSASQYAVEPADHTTLLRGPLGAVLMLGAERTDGRLSVVEHPLAPRALGSPVHTHRHEDEYSVVLEGVVGAPAGRCLRASGRTARPGLTRHPAR